MSVSREPFKLQLSAAATTNSNTSNGKSPTRPCFKPADAAAPAESNGLFKPAVDNVDARPPATGVNDVAEAAEPRTKDAFTTMGLQMVPQTAAPNGVAPCEPGTSVTLEGVVWQETDGGNVLLSARTAN